MGKYIPPVFNISIHSQCVLKCEFCMKSLDRYEKYKPISAKKFERYVNIMTEYGVTMFEITPTVGDPMVTEPSLLKQYLDILERHPKIEIYLMYTSLVTPQSINTPEWSFLLNRSKMLLHISLYSVNYNNFKHRTGGDRKKYKTLKDNIYYIIKNSRSIKTIIIDRTGNEDLYSDDSANTCRPDIFFKKIIKTLKSPDCRVFTKFSSPDWNYNLTKTQTAKSRHNGICTYMLMDGGVYPDGSVSLCTWIDCNKKMITGNLETTTPDELYKDYWAMSSGRECLNVNSLKFDKKYYMCDNCDFSAPAGTDDMSLEQCVSAIKQEFRDIMKWIDTGGEYNDTSNYE